LKRCAESFSLALAPFEAAKVKIQTTPGFANTLRQAWPRHLRFLQGFGPIVDASDPIHHDEIRLLREDRRIVVYVSILIESVFDRVSTVIFFRHVVPKPRAECTKGEQLIVTFGAGYIAGVFCAIVSHPADVVVSKLNQAKGASAFDVAKKLGFMGMWNGLTPRIIMIGTLTALQWFIYDGVKVALQIPRPPPMEMPESLKKKLGVTE